MGSSSLLSPWLSWKRMVGIFFLPFILSGFGPRFKQEENLVIGKAHPPQPRVSAVPPSSLPSSLPSPLSLSTFFPSPASSRFNWSHLTPLELKNRSVGLGTESTGQGNPHFTLEGHKFLIFGGSIHYFRVPREYWRDRLLKLKACGLNTVTTYVPWNLHEPERGKFDFSGNLDLEAFVLMASEIGLWVILRPGPYICSEIDLGGLPSWLLQDPRLLLRTTNKGFMEAVEKYFDHLIPRVIPLQYRQGGPVIAMQVENEYGSFNKDKKYMPYLRKALLRRGIVELLLTSDGEKNVLSGHTKGALATINLQKLHRNIFNQLHKVQRDKPLLIMEYWVGWFDRWGDKHHVMDAKEIERTVSEFIKYEISFNVYMFHGGTNFGFLNGATYFGKHTGVVTSYDYDAVLTEAGDYTEKYFKLQKLFGSFSAIPLPRVPKLTPKAAYSPVRPSLYLPLWDALAYLNEPVRSHQPINMENLPINNGSGQSYGFVLYEKSICSGGRLCAHAHDMAQVFLDETMIGILNENNQNLHIPELRVCRYLRILVENQGRVNFSWQIQNERKGITGSVSISNSSLEGFTIYSLEMKRSFFERLRSATWRPVPDSHPGPAFYRGTLRAGPSPKDTFLSLRNWNYGFVFINGRNLGRYWNIGPQKTLYLPGAWLHPEDNEVIVFEKMLSGSDIESTDKPML
ncbi:beta-galactosidase-1-like protein 3 isoform X1 [Saimiri boliviensis]|uniref:beta-galactosidase-1-like protein 3 isoform X1 n=1 Tax=Saimiri boliviensis TaxID=27679 RepID=UPI00193DA365|nr:beta-galactosidase-1-like protein 3 isoform X2 [Saimiri boliviensis boliviensis]